MNYEHPRWDEFIDRLAGPEEGIDIYSLEPAGDTFGGQCMASKILSRMEGIDVLASLEWMEERDGYCDYAIIWDMAVPLFYKRPKALNTANTKFERTLQLMDNILFNFGFSMEIRNCSIEIRTLFEAKQLSPQIDEMVSELK